MTIQGSKAQMIGSANCPSVRRSVTEVAAGGGGGNEITNIVLDSDSGTLTIYLNPSIIQSVKIPEILDILQVSLATNSLTQTKVNKSFKINTDNGIQGGSDLYSTSLTLQIKPNDPHIELTPEGLKIKKFNEVETSGVVNAPPVNLRTNEYYLNALGQWTKLGVLLLKGVLAVNSTLTDNDVGDMYIIKTFEDPQASIIVNGTTFYSAEVIAWEGTIFVNIGKVSVRVNLGAVVSDVDITITNTSGNLASLVGATHTQAGILTAADKTLIDTMSEAWRVSAIEPYSISDGIVEFNFWESNNNNRTKYQILFPKSSKYQPGTISSSDFIRLDTISTKDLVDSISGTLNPNKFTISSHRSKITGTPVLESPVDIPVVGTPEAGLNAGLVSKTWYSSINTDIDTPTDWNAPLKNKSIINKPKVLANGITPTNLDNGCLIKMPSILGRNSFLNDNGEWAIPKAGVQVTVSATEPTGQDASEGSFWIMT